MTVTAEPVGATLRAWTVDVHYDPGQVTVTGCMPAAGGVCNAGYASGVVRIPGASASGLSGNHTLATLTLAESGAAARGGSAEAGLSLRAVELADPSGAALAATAAASGTVSGGSAVRNGSP